MTDGRPVSRREFYPSQGLDRVSFGNASFDVIKTPGSRWDAECPGNAAVLALGWSPS